VTAASATDPRVERSRQLICDATLDELAEVGYGAMTIESIARRAGVGKATIYRHWNGKLDLVESALDNVKADPEVPAGGSARERITAMLHWLADYLYDSERSACMPAMVSAAHYDDAVRTFHHRFSAERRTVMVGLVEDGISAGEFHNRLDARLVAETLLGPLFYRRLMTPDPFPPDEVDRIVDLVLG
jgi:TetR/AcrR family transcriptional regulator of autoinduction and epiphytic fitness